MVKSNCHLLLLLLLQPHSNFWLFLLCFYFLTGSASPSQNSGESLDYSAHAEALIRALNEVASSTSGSRFGGWTSSEDEIDDDLEQAGGSKSTPPEIILLSRPLILVC